MKIKIRGQEFEQKVEVLNCIFCPYEDSCSSFGCCSPACSLTNECFDNKSEGTWCPFGEIPKDHQNQVTVIERNVTKNIRKAVKHELREDCRKEALIILELCSDKDREDFLRNHQEDNGNICCLILDFAKKKLVEAGRMEYNETDCFQDPYKWIDEKDENEKE